MQRSLIDDVRFDERGLVPAIVQDAATGAVVWSRNVASNTGTDVPTWGFSSSPLMADDVLVVAASGTLAAFDAATGHPRWVGAHHSSYSSPQLMTIDGVAQVLQMSEAGVVSVAPADGTRLWEHQWEGVTIVQPARMAGGDLLISISGATGGIGLRRLAVAHGPDGWTATERWTSNGLKPYFNDFVVHKGHAFGFDGNILSCIDLQDGKRKWKGGRYGNGQLVLLADQGLLLVVSEEGELALVKATPGQFTELARRPPRSPSRLGCSPADGSWTVASGICGCQRAGSAWRYPCSADLKPAPHKTTLQRGSTEARATARIAGGGRILADFREKMARQKNAAEEDVAPPRKRSRGKAA